MAQEASDIDVEVVQAKRAVANARAKFGSELVVATETGRSVLARVTHQARPVLIGIAILAGLIVVAETVRLVRSAVPRPRYPDPLRGHDSQSGLGRVVRSALTSLAWTLTTTAAKGALRSVLERSVERAAPAADTGATRSPFAAYEGAESP